MTLDLGRMTIGDLQRLYREKKLSPVEVVEVTLRAQQEWEPALNAFITVLTEQSMEQARQAEAAFMADEESPPLTGVPVMVKDLFYTEGILTTCGARIMADYVPDYSATAVTRLADAGAILIGKTNALEFAYGVVHPDFGQCNNPWDPSHTSGGSSSGSAASLAAGLGFGSLGTDTGGSIRIPASYCGIVGLKSTYGRISRYGVFPLSWSLDHVGPMGRTAADVAAVLGVVAGPDEHDATSTTHPVDDYVASLDFKVAGLRVGMLVQHLGDDLVPDVKDAFLSALGVLEDLGLEVVEVVIPDLLKADPALMGVIFPEATSVHERWLCQRPEDYALATRDQLELGAVYPVLEYLRAQRFRTLLRRRVDDLLETVDLLVSPTVAFPAPETDPVFGDPEEGASESRRTSPANLTGHPAVSIPCGFTPEGLPVGLQLTGRGFDEATLLRVAHAYEQAAGWSRMRPEVPGK